MLAHAFLALFFLNLDPIFAAPASVRGNLGLLTPPATPGSNDPGSHGSSAPSSPSSHASSDSESAHQPYVDPHSPDGKDCRVMPYVLETNKWAAKIYFMTLLQHARPHLLPVHHDYVFGFEDVDFTTHHGELAPRFSYRVVCSDGSHEGQRQYYWAQNVFGDIQAGGAMETGEMYLGENQEGTLLVRVVGGQVQSGIAANAH
ncbi:hypothetical protein F5878DRAFT_323336 [Lentinula raphanica]|uniref:Uncharacterized protein n=1 Tax=Lentinula raphanica TaxID=153919 RepID=A0AA38P2W4_9AGAR|nr:hypothetical protein F5878DRAFT_323336 [Lentinula raphanica]